MVPPCREVQDHYNQVCNLCVDLRSTNRWHDWSRLGLHKVVGRRQHGRHTRNRSVRIGPGACWWRPLSTPACGSGRTVGPRHATALTIPRSRRRVCRKCRFAGFRHAPAVVADRATDACLVPRLSGRARNVRDVLGLHALTGGEPRAAVVPGGEVVDDADQLELVARAADERSDIDDVRLHTLRLRCVEADSWFCRS